MLRLSNLNIKFKINITTLSTPTHIKHKAKGAHVAEQRVGYSSAAGIVRCCSRETALLESERGKQAGPRASELETREQKFEREKTTSLTAM